MYFEDDYIQLSALQHFLFCRRQCALIHIEQNWQENKFTIEGKILHEKADAQCARRQGSDVKIEYGLLIRSRELGLSGKADVVEFHRSGTHDWNPFPVEYKRGKPKEIRCDEVQLCAQALCLEEMMGVKIPCGFLYYGKTRHRDDVLFDDVLRKLTIQTISDLRKLIESRRTPEPAYEREKCDSCSMLELCMPKAAAKSASAYVRKCLEDNEKAP
ncbi:MAG TPA: CRISPR-associated protein Cas4 [Lentisphaeria bacterium]|nr:MAG: CRISPR-associated protein Cas4 [Lentisphaerae bacterium GWF2_49_21]HBC88773.1 CRISPR-associated protein Cas4 [Lentisphaeria bacterium]